jgi:hypothetical protein
MDRSKSVSLNGDASLQVQIDSQGQQCLQVSEHVGMFHSDPDTKVQTSSKHLHGYITAITLYKREVKLPVQIRQSL